MRNHSLSGNIAAVLRRCKELESSMRKVGIPAFLACLPVTLLALQYALMLREKNAGISRISGKIEGWTATVRELSAHEHGRSEFIDLDRKMRGDIEGACESMRALRDLCVEICAMFSAFGYESGMLRRCRDRFDTAVNEACRRSQLLMTAVDEHDRRALAIRQQEHAIQQAGAASAAAHAARVAAGLDA
ncbi:hypothetical protein GTP41_07895 [Pseudoduganella sp. DS3]|uniref:Uncharacterized protein n=1 Tax=Pseudoduganella guangdongensis TaxID=2692179 RepID=A0A6N9HG15_9BURK|nr:hypothetical protein [Pseudoduganella guangdongensis]MYN02023.1 hypothetical protein [Pseudoduganella guangdongensis]